MRYVRYTFFACLAVVYFAVFPYNHGLNNPNENARVYTTIALVEHHTWRIDEEVARFGPINDNALVGGHQYAAKAPGASLLGAPIYWLFSKIAPRFVSPDDSRAWLTATTLVLRLLLVQLPCFLFLIWFHGWIRRACADAALAWMATAALGVGTNYLAYSLMFASHSLSAAVAFVAFALIADKERPFLVGNLLGLLTLFEYQGAALSAILGLYALVSYRERGARLRFCAGAAIYVAALLAFQRAAFGGVLRTPFRYLEDEHLRAHHEHGFMGLGAPSLTAIVSLCFDRTVGMFGTSPFLLLMPLALPFAWGDRRVRWAAATVTLVVVVVSGITNWRAGWSIGPRYLVAVAPFAVFVAAVGLARFGARGSLARATALGVAGGLVVASTATVGLISIVINTLPYDIRSPLAQVALPFLRAGFVPHHAGELFGWTSPAFFSVVVVALFAAALLAACAEPRGTPARWPIAIAVCVVALLPALRLPHECPRGVRRLTEIWEPADRDRIQSLRAATAQQPCLWRKVAALERSICWEGADEDDLRAFGLGCR